MRFNFEELYDTSRSDSESSVDENDFTIIGGDDEGIPQLRLPRLYSKGKPKEEEEPIILDSELQEILSKLDIHSKLPTPANNLLVHRLSNPIENVRQEGSLRIEMPVWNAGRDTDQGINRIIEDIERKLTIIEQENDNQVAKVRRHKERIEEERKQHLEDERRRKEEEERMRREEEEERLKKEKIKREKEEAERQRKAEEEEQRRKAQLKLEEQKRKQHEEEEVRRAQEEAKKSRGHTNFKEIESNFITYKKKIEEIKSDILEPVKNDKSLKSTLSKYKRKINPKFGQLTNSEQQLQSITHDLIGLINETKPNALAYQWILNFIAKALVSQAETEVRVKPESAVPLARLALILLVMYPELLELLMARFIKKCPLVIGYTCSIDSEEGRLRMGWKRNKDGRWEDDVSYDERMGGIATLFSVITRLRLPNEFSETHDHPLPITHSWKLLARIANTPIELLTNTHFVVLGSWWDAAAADFVQMFGRQARKLLILVSDDLTIAVADRKYVGAARLRILSEEWMTTGTIVSFPQMTP